MAEVVFHLRRNHLDWDGARITSVRDRITETFEVGRVVDYAVSPAEGVKDINDWHVHAAALACGADILLTCNVKDLAAGDTRKSTSPAS